MNNHHFFLKVHSSKSTIQTWEIDANDAEAVRLRASRHVRYELVNQQTGFAPNNVMTQRDGDDLWIMIEGERAQPDVIIEDYYRFGEANVLIGRDVDGAYYRYVPESGHVGDAVPMLADHVVAGQALGGDALSSPLWQFDSVWLLSLLPVLVTTAVATGVGHHHDDGGGQVVEAVDGDGAGDGSVSSGETLFLRVDDAPVLALDEVRSVALKQAGEVSVVNDVSVLRLTLADVMGGGVNVLNGGKVVSGSISLGESVLRHQLLIKGDDVDTVAIVDAANWHQQSVGTVSQDGHIYHVYRSVDEQQGQLLIDEHVNVQFIV